MNFPLAVVVLIVNTAILSGGLDTQCRPNYTVDRMRMGNPHHFHPGPFRDHVLRGKVYSITTRSHATCAVLCLQEVACKSFNFCADDRRCEFNSAVFAKDKSDLQQASGCFYFDEEYHEECNSFASTYTYSFNFIFPRLNSSDSFRLDFAAKGTHDAILALSEQANEVKLYEVAIGGWSNQQSGFCYGKHCPSPIKSPTPDIMDGSEYRRFWLSYDHWTIQVGKDGEINPFMEWHDNNRNVQVNYIGITSYNNPVDWIFYNYCVI